MQENNLMNNVSLSTEFVHALGEPGIDDDDEDEDDEDESQDEAAGGPKSPKQP
jgi:hypothetical protein